MNNVYEYLRGVDQTYLDDEIHKYLKLKSLKQIKEDYNNKYSLSGIDRHLLQGEDYNECMK